jgi:hypothetical protein
MELLYILFTHIFGLFTFHLFAPVVCLQNLVSLIWKNKDKTNLKEGTCELGNEHSGSIKGGEFD